jgi:hypothetical protein
VSRIPAATGTRIQAKCSLISTVAADQAAARATRCGRCAASSSASTANGSSA